MLLAKLSTVSLFGKASETLNCNSSARPMQRNRLTGLETFVREIEVRTGISISWEDEIETEMIRGK